MAHQEISGNWHSADTAFQREPTCSTHAPGVYSSVTSDLPDRIHGMKGLASAYFSHHSSTREGPDAVAIYGEFAAVRTEGTSTKAYIYAFGVSSDGRRCFNGPYTDSGHHHHYSCSSTFAPADLFGFVSYRESSHSTS